MRLRNLAILVLAGACTVDPYHIGFSSDGAPDGEDLADGGSEGDGAGGVDGGDAAPADAPTIDGCAISSEVCDGVDNDCDGQTDETFNFEADPANCGGCGVRCDRPNMLGTCVARVCEYECLPCFHDNDPMVPGCEYECCVTGGGVEACDHRDNDCDGQTDEGFDTLTDLDNCGDCGRPCRALHATAACSAGLCTFTSCDAGYADLLPNVFGCEYRCPVFPAVAEACNNLDDDCDGLVDEGSPGGGAACGSDVGECAPGTTSCVFGSLVCTGTTGPAPETCDNLDNDCDMVVDDGFDKLGDPRYCAGCAGCSLPHAVEGCSGGACTVAACDAGWRDQNASPADGCEYFCTPTGPEVCDGLDNDCDRLVDAADPSLVAAPNFCNGQGACAGTTPVCGATACDPAVRWRCVYGGATEHDACGALAVQEARCDGVDGDCDGGIDEAFPLKGAACNDGVVGQCRGTGTYVCDAAQTGVACNITTPGATPQAEACNGLDDDCDGLLDDGAPDVMVHVVGGGADYWIYTHEASRPDATGAAEGLQGHRSCSRAGVLPWRNVTWAEASAACTAAGLRLCTESEWQRACAGAGNLAYPYGNAYSPTACNGNDYDADCALPDDDRLMSTGTSYGCPPPGASQCVSGYGAFDLSGNLKEWTGTQVSASPLAYRIRGGAFDNIAAGLTCQFDFLSGEATYEFANLGFRCCANTIP